MDHRQLVNHFAQAQLPLALVGQTGRPTARGLDDIVQLSIEAARGARPERFVIRPGASTNELAVQAVDSTLRQLVLEVREPRRAFEVHARKDQPRVKGIEILRTDAWGRWERHYTQASQRQFLAGLDEAHLFLAQLPRPASTVWSAHRILEGDAVRLAQRSAWEPTVRQGEWFFVSLLPRELARLERALDRQPRALVQCKGLAEVANIARLGKPHVAAELCRVGERTYARGSVEHPDHATIVLPAWRRVLVNAEQLTRPTGLQWVD